MINNWLATFAVVFVTGLLAITIAVFPSLILNLLFWSLLVSLFVGYTTRDVVLFGR